MSYGCVKCLACKHYRPGREYMEACTKRFPAETPRTCSHYQALDAAKTKEAGR